jgi:hypothetical protein
MRIQENHFHQVQLKRKSFIPPVEKDERVFNEVQNQYSEA